MDYAIRLLDRDIVSTSLRSCMLGQRYHWCPSNVVECCHESRSLYHFVVETGWSSQAWKNGVRTESIVALIIIMRGRRKEDYLIYIHDDDDDDDDDNNNK